MPVPGTHEAIIACTVPGAVLLIDTFEQCQSLEAWLRETFLLRLADGAVVVLAGRVAPDPEWSLDPGWAPLFTALAVRPLDAAQSDALLAARGVPAEQRGTADLRGAITVALDALQTDPAGIRAHEALTATYIAASRTHRAAARRLGVPTAPTAATSRWPRHASPNSYCGSSAPGDVRRPSVVAAV